MLKYGLPMSKLGMLTTSRFCSNPGNLILLTPAAPTVLMAKPEAINKPENFGEKTKRVAKHLGIIAIGALIGVSLLSG